MKQKSVCECCELVVNEDVLCVRAKEVYPDIRNVLIEEAYACENEECDFWLDYEDGCAELYVCSSCPYTGKAKEAFEEIRR